MDEQEWDRRMEDYAPGITTMLEAAVTYHELYSSFMAAGFDEDQAMTLLIATINRSGGVQ